MYILGDCGGLVNTRMYVSVATTAKRCHAMLVNFQFASIAFNSEWLNGTAWHKSVQPRCLHALPMAAVRSEKALFAMR